jgi:uncharacterized damage-inducible protein DinB
MRYTMLVPLALLVAAGAPLAAAQSPTAPGARGDIQLQLDDASTKLVQLAEAMPAASYTWRPAQGVRSVSEVFMHVAGANYFFPTFVGVTATPPFPQDAATAVTDKAQVVQYLKGSFDHARSAIGAVADGDLDKKVTVFGREMTYRNLLLTMTSHAHEHLGQAIAYARSNGVTPPWSLPRE